MASDLVKNETVKHREAFNLYYSLGAARSLRTVAAKYDISYDTAKIWSKSFDWQARAQERDAETIEEDGGEAKLRAKEARVQALDMIKVMLDRFQSHLKDKGDIQFYVSDLDKLLKLQALIMGGSDPRSQGSIDTDLSGLSEEELKSLALQEIGKLQGLGILPESLEMIRAPDEPEEEAPLRGGSSAVPSPRPPKPPDPEPELEPTALVGVTG